MTSEVVLMNRSAVAMAADSAVTISGANYLKTYQSVDKLFPLVEGQPVAVMIYSNAEIMSTPWETVISLYRDYANGKTMDTIDAYAQDFLQFLSNNPNLFSPDQQDTEIFKHFLTIFIVVAQDFDYQVAQFQQSNAGSLREHLNFIFEHVVQQLHKAYQTNLDGQPVADLSCFPRGMDAKIKKKYGDGVRELMDSMIHSIKQEHPALTVSEASKQQLFDIAIWSVTKDMFLEHYTGVVVSGFGRQDKFPAMRSYLTSTVVMGQLKQRHDRFAEMTSESGPVVQPFAQDRMIRTFLTGIDQYLRMFTFTEAIKLTSHITQDLIGRVPITDDQKHKLLSEYSQSNLTDAMHEFFYNIDRYQHVVHTMPIYRAIQMLPKKELGETAASLIKLNSFQQKVMNSVETVGGPIDVAVITRNGGLEWKKEAAEL